MPCAYANTICNGLTAKSDDVMRDHWWGLRRVLAGLALLTALATPLRAASPGRRVLFVGNSLTYVNNLPSAFASLAPEGAVLTVDGFARPGARLQDEIGNVRLAQLLARGRYTDVVFQERGGDAVCRFDDATCGGLRDASATTRASLILARAARAGGARVFYLGTYQLSPQVVPWLLHGERHVAELMKATYIELGATWMDARSLYPKADWLASDGTHPGYATTALMALRSWRAVMGVASNRIPCVTGSLFTKAPSADGYFQTSHDGAPVTCLVSESLAASLSALP